MCWKCLILTVGRLRCTYLFSYTIRHKLKTIKSAFKSDHAEQMTDIGVGVKLKVGDKYWEDWRGGVWGGALPSPVGGLGACSRKKSAKNYAILHNFWYFFAILQQKVGGYPPVLKVRGPMPLSPPPCSDAFDDGQVCQQVCWIDANNFNLRLVSPILVIRKKFCNFKVLFTKHFGTLSVYFLSICVSFV